MSVRLPETQSCSASCASRTGEGRALSHALSASVRGPAAMSASDGRVRGGGRRAAVFAVTLSHAASGRVTGDYQTRDGSAQAGEDYSAASGTLTFAAGESSKTIEIGVLDEAHDEGEDTFMLALSNASGARLEDAEATGTIENTDLMPGALLARFGRTAAEQVVEHVEQWAPLRQVRPQWGTHLSGHGAGSPGMTRTTGSNGGQPPRGGTAAMPGGPAGAASALCRRAAICSPTPSWN